MDLPQEGTTQEVIIDKEGGWIYTVNTTVSISHQTIADYEREIQSKKEFIEESQGKVNEMEAVIAPLKEIKSK